MIETTNQTILLLLCEFEPNIQKHQPRALSTPHLCDSNNHLSALLQWQKTKREDTVSEKKQQHTPSGNLTQLLNMAHL